MCYHLVLMEPPSPFAGHAPCSSSILLGAIVDKDKGSPHKRSPSKRLEDYEPGATQDDVLAALRKAIQPSKKPSSPPAPSSSKT